MACEKLAAAGSKEAFAREWGVPDMTQFETSPRSRAFEEVRKAANQLLNKHSEAIKDHRKYMFTPSAMPTSRTKPLSPEKPSSPAKSTSDSSTTATSAGIRSDVTPSDALTGEEPSERSLE